MNINTSIGDLSSHGERAWFCVRSQPKREHIAAAHLQMLGDIEVFNPRLRVRKATRRGIVTFVEPLFPNYLFARFVPEILLAKVKYAPSVSTIVHFGHRVPKVPEEVIHELQEAFGSEQLQEVDRHVNPGDRVVIGNGPFSGMKATVLKVLTPHQRVEVLLEMLGRNTPAVLDPSCLVLESQY